MSSSRREPSVSRRDWLRSWAGGPPLRGWPTGTLLRVVSVASVVTLLLLWEWVTQSGRIPPLFLPAPSRVASAGARMLADGELLAHLLASARRVLVGFALASGVAVPLGIVLGTIPVMKAVFDPLVSIIRPLPSMSWIPLSLLWIGIKEEQKYAIVFMGSFASALLYTVEATRNIDPILVKAARNLGASRFQVMREVILPGALPSIIAGLKVVLGIAWTCVISAELVAANEGLGFLIMNGKEFFMTDQVLLGMAMISVTVVVLDSILSRVEALLVPWREE